MSNYRRNFVAGGTYFFTLVTYKRRRLFHVEKNVTYLRSAIASVQNELPFEINAAVILPDHMHFIWSLPSGDSNYSKRIGKLKVGFTKRFHSNDQLRCALPASRTKHRESDVWQRRFWEHTINDEDEFEQFFDYIHFNPVKHGHVNCPHEWNASSFHKWVKHGVLDVRWACSCNGSTANIRVADVAKLVGE